MKLPDPEHAVVDVRKLRDYILSPTHPRGRHKAPVFENALGLTQYDAETLRTALLQAARSYDAEPKEADGHGRRYVIEFEMTHRGKRAIIHSGWIVRADEDFARLTTCYVV